VFSAKWPALTGEAPKLGRGLFYLDRLSWRPPLLIRNEAWDAYHSSWRA
jgi:hypothetical protein